MLQLLLLLLLLAVPVLLTEAAGDFGALRALHQTYSFTITASHRAEDQRCGYFPDKAQ